MLHYPGKLLLEGIKGVFTEEMTFQLFFAGCVNSSRATKYAYGRKGKTVAVEGMVTFFAILQRKYMNPTHEV